MKNKEQLADFVDAMINRDEDGKIELAEGTLRSVIVNKVKGMINEEKDAKESITNYIMKHLGEHPDTVYGRIKDGEESYETLMDLVTELIDKAEAKLKVSLPFPDTDDGDEQYTKFQEKLVDKISTKFKT